MKERRQAGFTLVEMLVAVVIFLIIVFPFVTTYVVTGKLNQDALYMKRATDIIKLAGEDIRTWNDDILEVLSDRVDDGKLREWKYQKEWTIKHNVKDKDTGYIQLKEDSTSMYEIFRRALDGEENFKDNDLKITGTDWQKGMDIYFTVEKIQEETTQIGGDTTYQDVNVVNEVSEVDIRKGYDLSIRVEKERENVSDATSPIVDKIKISQNGKGIVKEMDNNGGRGYYLKVTLENGNSKYVLRKIPPEYVPLEKYTPTEKDGQEVRISFGGKDWLRVFEPTPGDVALMYAPKDLFLINKPFDVTGDVRFKRTNGWDNIASYLNDQFYNSLAYSTTDLNYTSRSWMKKHTWQIGPKDQEYNETVSEYVGLLKYSEIERIRPSVSQYLLNSCSGMTYTLTPASSTGMYLMSYDQVTPENVYSIYPMIYLDRDLYINNDGKLYESTDAVLKNGEIVGEGDEDEVTCEGSEVKVMVYFDNGLDEENLEGQYFEKVRLLVDVVDNRTNKTDSGLKIYTANNKKRGNYSWLEVRDVTRVMMEESNANSARFKVIDTLKVEEDANTQSTEWGSSTQNDSVKKAYITKEYQLNVWAEYMATDEHSYVNPNDYPDKSKLPKNKHEKLVLRVTTQKDKATFMYNGVEIDNIADIASIGLLNKMKDYYRVS